MKTKKIIYIDSGIIDEQASVVAEIHSMTAVGMVVHEDDGHVVLAREFDENERNWRGQIAIPKVAIINEWCLEPSE